MKSMQVFVVTHPDGTMTVRTRPVTDRPCSVARIRPKALRTIVRDARKNGTA